MFYDIYFDDRWGDSRFIGSCEKENIWSTISNWINKIAPNFKIYYVRSWEADGVIHYDVSSHTEFFRAVPIGNN